MCWQWAEVCVGNGMGRISTTNGWPGPACCLLAWFDVSTRDPGRWNVGRAGVYGHGLPARFLHQLPPVPARVPDYGAGGKLVTRRCGWFCPIMELSKNKMSER